MSMKHQTYSKSKIGALAEKLAQEYITKLGMNIIDKNFRTKFGEIDIIAKDQEEYVFIEVRSKSYTNFGLPEETISKKKQEKIINMAKWYLKSKQVTNSISCRFDVIAIVFTIKDGCLQPKINYIKNAFTE